MTNWDDLVDPKRKIPAAIRDGVIHCLKRKVTVWGCQSYCGEVFSCDEFLILLQRLDEINCPDCHEIAEARLGFKHIEVQRPVVKENIKNCPKCGQSLYLGEDGDLNCLCGKVVYTR